MCEDRSEIELEPRGRASRAAVKSACRRAGSRLNWLATRARSPLSICLSWKSQCTSSTYGFPRSLQNTVADSRALKVVASSLEKSLDLLISLMETPANGLRDPQRLQRQRLLREGRR